jgi:hypothetical protein
VSSECRGVCSSSCRRPCRRRVVIVSLSSSCGSRCLLVAGGQVALDACWWQGDKTDVLLWAGPARDASGESTARQQDKCLLLGRSVKTHRASVGGFVRCRVIVVSSSSLSLSSFDSRCLLVAGGWVALDASGESTARQQDKCLLLGRSGKMCRASVGGFVCRRCRVVVIVVVVVWLSMPFGGRWSGGS